MTINSVTSNTWLNGTGNGATLAKAYGVSVTSGNLLVCLGGVGGASSNPMTGISDSLSGTAWNAFTVNPQFTSGNSQGGIYGWWKVADASGACTVTIAQTAGRPNSIFINEYHSSTAGTWSVDGTAVASNFSNGAVTNPSPGTITTTGVNNVVLGFMGSYATPTAGSGFTIRATRSDWDTDTVEDQFFTSGTSWTPNWTMASAAAVALGISFTCAAAAGITFDASSNSGDQASVSTFTFTRTVSKANPFLALDVGLLSTPSATVTAIDDYGGGNVNIPIIGSQVVTGIGLIVSLGLANPASGTKTIQVNLSTSLTSGAIATCYGGVDQIEPVEAFNSAQGVNVGAANASVTVTPVSDKTWIHAATVTNDATATNNQTSRGTVTDAVLGRVLAEDNNAAVTPAAATTMTSAIAAAKAWAIAGYAIKPVGSADPLPRFVMLWQAVKRGALF